MNEQKYLSIFWCFCKSYTLHQSNIVSDISVDSGFTAINTYSNISLMSMTLTWMIIRGGTPVDKMTTKSNILQRNGFK